jgi:acetyltransferase-like isoleucine patch superfamily enzyme
MIYRILNKLVDLAALALSVVMRQPVIDLLKRFGRRVQWYAARRRFKSVGRGANVEAPFSFLNPQNVTIGSNFSARSNFLLETIEEYQGKRFTPQVVIGNNVSFYCDCHVGCVNRIVIEDNVLLASGVYITDHFHGTTTGADRDLPPALRALVSKGPVIIGKNAWIGEGVAIMPGVTIGENAIIGANSVITKDIPKNCVAAGVPAAVIKQWE